MTSASRVGTSAVDRASARYSNAAPAKVTSGLSGFARPKYSSGVRVTAAATAGAADRLASARNTKIATARPSTSDDVSCDSATFDTRRAHSRSVTATRSSQARSTASRRSTAKMSASDGKPRPSKVGA